MPRQTLTRADTKGNSRDADLHPPTGLDFLKLLAWPALFYGAGIVLFLAVYAAQLMGWVS